MEEVSVEELVRKAFQKLTAISVSLKLSRRLSVISGEYLCPFYREGKCTNPFNPDRFCTEAPSNCPHIMRLLAVSHPLPISLVPVREMVDKNIIKLYISGENILVKPSGEEYISYANRAKMLIENALSIYGSSYRVEVIE